MARKPKARSTKGRATKPPRTSEADASQAAYARPAKTGQGKASEANKVGASPADGRGTRRTVARKAHARPVLVMGMHRSGTSLTARVINLLGVSLGREETMLPRRFDNPGGYWEQEPIMRVNEAILEALGGSWDAPPALPEGWHEDDRVVPLKETAKQALRDCGLDEKDGFAIKDPRLSLTLSFWLDLFPGARCVVCLRNPLEVVASSITRAPQADTAQTIVRNWLRYTAHGLEQSADQPRLLTLYEDYFERLDEEIARLARFVRGNARSGGTVSARARREIGQFVDSTLRHHVIGLDELAGTKTLAAESRALYLAAKTTRRLEVGRNGEGVAPDTFTDSLGPIARGLLDTYAERHRLQRGDGGREGSRRTAQEVERLRTKLDQREKELEQTRAELRTERETVQTVERERAEQGARLEQRAKKLKERAMEHGRVVSKLEQKTSQLEASEREVQSTREVIEQARNALEERDSQLQANTAELEQLRAELVKERKSAAHAQKELDERSSQLEARTAELEQLRAELVKERKSAAHAQKELDERSSQLEARTAELEEMTAERDRSGDQLEVQRVELTSLRTELSRARMELDRLRDPIALSTAAGQS
jgi:hypothetical protein